MILTSMSGDGEGPAAFVLTVGPITPGKVMYLARPT
jgi:hypothetical protein